MDDKLEGFQSVLGGIKQRVDGSAPGLQASLAISLPSLSPNPSEAPPVSLK